MPIVFACDCRRTLAVPYAAAGLLTRCPRCGAVLQVPWFSDPRAANALAEETVVAQTAAGSTPDGPFADALNPGPARRNLRDYARWLDPGTTEPTLQALLRPYEGELAAHPDLARNTEWSGSKPDCRRPPAWRSAGYAHWNRPIRPLQSGSGLGMRREGGSNLTGGRS